MRLKEPQIHKLARLIYDALVKDKLIDILSSDKAVLAKIETILTTDARIEEQIEAEAKKMMEKFQKQVESGEIEYQKMYNMLKKQLMKDKKFVT